MDNEQTTIAKHVRVVRVGLTTSFVGLAGLVLAALQEALPSKVEVIQIVGYCSAEWKYRDPKNTSSYRTVAASTEKVIPALDAFANIQVAASSGTPTLEVELFLA